MSVTRRVRYASETTLRNSAVRCSVQVKFHTRCQVSAHCRRTAQLDQYGDMPYILNSTHANKCLAPEI
jgi:hypothetical protein